MKSRSTSKFRRSQPDLAKTLCFVALWGCGILFAAGGCSKSSPPSATAAEFESAYKGTPSHVKDFAQQAVAAEANKDYGTAFVHYRALSKNPDLTPEQRNAADRAMLEMNAKLRQASTNGDAQAEAVLKMYRATK